jgi:hypothetical protein
VKPNAITFITCVLSEDSTAHDDWRLKVDNIVAKLEGLQYLGAGRPVKGSNYTPRSVCFGQLCINTGVGKRQNGRNRV